MSIITRLLFFGIIFFLPFQTFSIDVGFSLKLSQIFLILLIFFLLSQGTLFIRVFKGGHYHLISILLFNIVAILISTIYATDIERSVILLIAWVFCLSAVVVIGVCASDREWLKNAINIYIISACITSVYGLLQLVLFLLGYDSNVNFETWDLIPRVPFLSNENYHSGFLIIALAFQISRALYRKDKALDRALIILNLSALFAANSRGAIIAFAIGMLFMWMIFAKVLPKRASIVFIIIAILSSIFIVQTWDTIFIRLASISVEDGPISERFRTYEFAYLLWIDQPFVGSGLGSIIGRTGHDVHNMFLMLLFEAGLVTFIPFVILIFYITLILWERRTRLIKLSDDNWIFLGVCGAFFMVLLQSLSEPGLYSFHFYVLIGFIVGCCLPIPEKNMYFNKSLGSIFDNFPITRGINKNNYLHTIKKFHKSKV